MSEANLKLQITNDMKEAMKARDQKRLDAIRLLLAAIKQREVDERITLENSDVLEIISKMIKQRRESIDQYQSAGRIDLVKQEEFEVQILQTYLPAALSEAELTSIIQDAVKSTGATSIKDLGKVMAIVKPKVQGRADMGAVSAKLKSMLG
jgi:uncharacterized protein YqeY